MAEQSTARFQNGERVLLLAGEYEGQVGTVAASQEVQGAWQYGVAGIKGIGENLYAVHGHEINPATEEDMEEPVFVPELPPVNGSGNNIPEPQSSGFNLASQLQNVANMAASQDQVTQGTFQQILERLDNIDKRLEVKEIKVVVEVQHSYPSVPKQKGGHETTWKVGETADLKPIVKIDDRQLDFFERDRDYSEEE